MNTHGYACNFTPAAAARGRVKAKETSRQKFLERLRRELQAELKDLKPYGVPESLALRVLLRVRHRNYRRGYGAAYLRFW